MKLTNILLATTLLVSSSFASEFVSYKELSGKLLKENEKNGLRATTEEVKKALKSKDTLVVDVRTLEEWQAGHIKGSVRVGRQVPEKAIASFVLDDDGKFIKDKLIVVCNSAHRASIQAEIFRKMGFKQVKVYPIHQWIDECNPIITKYSRHSYKGGKKNRFGAFYAEKCFEKR
jgi:rhodanese-related sulfurtransferase